MIADSCSHSVWSPNDPGVCNAASAIHHRANNIRALAGLHCHESRDTNSHHPPPPEKGSGVPGLFPDLPSPLPSQLKTIHVSEQVLDQGRLPIPTCLWTGAMSLHRKHPGSVPGVFCERQLPPEHPPCGQGLPLPRLAPSL